MSHTGVMYNSILDISRRILPSFILRGLLPSYHWTLSLLAAIWYRFPSRQIKVIAITGTKGKSSTVEILNAILEEAGYKTALSNTIRFKVGDISTENLYKMSMPGRFFAQRLLHKAVKAGCDYMIMEMTSQGALLHRHRWIELDAFVLTNISPEHIEAHGSFESYVDAKLDIARSLGRSEKKNRALIVNADDAQADRFLACDADRKTSYSIHDVEPYILQKEGLDFNLDGRRANSHLSGLFNLYNITAAVTAAKSQGVTPEVMVRAIGKFNGIPGRVEHIEAGQDYTVVVDYAHTADSLEKLYQVFPTTKNICVLGGTGGGRDTGKRAVMGKIADTYCDEIILTNEDPYDEDPESIVADIKAGITNKKIEIIMDRREAIRTALRHANLGSTVLISGKGTDPYIMEAKNKRTPWSDAEIAREELQKLV